MRAIAGTSAISRSRDTSNSRGTSNSRYTNNRKTQELSMEVRTSATVGSTATAQQLQGCWLMNFSEIMRKIVKFAKKSEKIKKNQFNIQKIV